MKKILQIALLLITVVTFAQSSFEGKIVSQQTMSSDTPEVQEQLAYMGVMSTIQYVKGSNSRTELNSPMTGKMTSIYTAKTDEVLVLMDNPTTGKKYMKASASKLKEQAGAQKVEVTKGEETKTILGYECVQYFMAMEANGTKMNMELFVTDKIAMVVTDQNIAYADKINGMPLLIKGKVNQMGMDINITNSVIEIVEESVSTDKFDTTIPEGFTSLDINKK